jgi:hypothetical protein
MKSRELYAERGGTTTKTMNTRLEILEILEFLPASEALRVYFLLCCSSSCCCSCCCSCC